VVILGFLILVGLKLTPVYIENWSIKKVFKAMAADPAMQGATIKDIRSSYDRRATIENITSIKSSDLEVSNNGESTEISVNYSVKVPIVANVSACIDFAESAVTGQ
jgi:hypothetical protein